jgi:hypothetical protein
LYFVSSMSLMITCFQQLTFNVRYVVVKVHDSWMEFRDYFRQQVPFGSEN